MNCPRCGRLLTSHASIDRGHGTACYIEELEKQVSHLRDRIGYLTIALDIRSSPPPTRRPHAARYR